MKLEIINRPVRSGRMLLIIKMDKKDGFFKLDRLQTSMARSWQRSLQIPQDQLTPHTYDCEIYPPTREHRHTDLNGQRTLLMLHLNNTATIFKMSKLIHSRGDDTLLRNFCPSGWMEWSLCSIRVQGKKISMCSRACEYEALNHAIKNPI